MAERIDLPPTLQGDENNQLQQMWSYLYQLSEAINSNLDAIGGNDLTDKERQSMQQILQAAGVTQDGVSTDYETLKSLIIKTADFVQTGLQEYRTVLFGETVAASQFGQINRRTGMDVAVTPEGVLQKFSLREIVKDLKTYEINAKNYIKTGLLRTENDLPVYGVAIGKDVVTFSENGTETYNDGNKVAELTADELSFWQNGVKVAGYTGNKISFYYNGTEVFYIQSGKLYAANDMEMGAGKNIKLGNWEINDSGIVNRYKWMPGTALEKNVAFAIGKEESLYGNNADTLGYGHRFVLRNMIYTPEFWLSVKRNNSNDVARLVLTPWNLYSESSTPDDPSSAIDITPTLGMKDSYTYQRKWNVIGETVYYNNLVQYSSRNIKREIKELKSVGDKLDKLKPVTFIYYDDKSNRKHTGLIYEDTKNIMPELCVEDKKSMSITYIELVPMLLKEIQDLRARVKALEER